MTTRSRYLPILYILAGIVLGIFVGVSISRSWAILLLRIIAVGLILTIALFWRRIESHAHKRCLDTWSMRRVRGRWSFILIQYLVVRGSLIFAAFAGPMLLQPPMTNQTTTIIPAFSFLLIVAMIYLGNESWKECERDYEIQTLRNLAQQTRTASN